ncbi:MAG: polyprenyl synthetase family protein [Candidatus Hydrogenedentota bacterium]
MDVEAFLAAKGARTEAALEEHIAAWRNVPPRLADAIRYSLFAGGKRLRPALALGAADVIAGDDAPALPAACAVEMIHTYSLMHDDLPAMDNDDLRRGKPTLHRAFDEATAILAGDGLLTMAFGVLAESGNAAIVAEMAHAAGVAGMVGGQMRDLAAENHRLTLEALQQIHTCKTGALIRVSVRAGALLAGAAGEQLAALTRYGENIGLAFQIADDILNVTSTAAVLGKPVGSDKTRHKSTYPGLVGIEQARARGAEAVGNAIETLTPFGAEADVFRALAQYIMERNR